MSKIMDLRRVARDAQRGYALGTVALGTMQGAQRAYDAARVAEAREATAEADRQERDDLAARLRTRLEQPVPPLSTAPIGWISRDRAKWLGMAAAVAGGAVYVEPGLLLDGWPLIGDGRMPSGEPVADGRLIPRAQLVAHIRERLARAVGCEPCLADDVDLAIRILDAIESR